MTAINHALTGAVIGLTINNPALAAGLSLVSHYALDALPHYGPAKSNIGGNTFRNYLLGDMALCGLLVVGLAVSAPQHWLEAAVCAFLATLPDSMWLSDFLQARKGHKARNISKRGLLVRLHGKVQWYQKPLGAITEIGWAGAAITTLTVLAR